MNTHKKHESGWALLFVFMLAASVAIMLYMELPRVAFESQRAKEQLLIDRGEQYSIAVRRYYTKLGKYPAKMEDLEDTNGRHYLRHRYKDPMTGKDDWRIVHIGPTGQLTDSKLQPPPVSPTGQSPSGQPFGQQQQGQGIATASASFGTSATAQTGSQQTDSQQADSQPVVNMAAIRRPSDRGTAPTLPSQGAADQENPDQNADANLPQDEQNPGEQPNPVEPNVPGENPANTGAPGQVANQRNGAFVPPNVVPPNGIPVNGGPNNPSANNSGIPVYPQGQNPGQFGQPVPGMYRPGQQNQSTTTQGGGSLGTNPAVPAAVTNQIFGSNPQGQAQAGTGTSPFGNNSLGTTGIAGVASTFNAEGIMRYKDQSKYVKWEFVFTPASGAGTPGQQNPNANPLNPQQNQQNQQQSPFAPSPSSGTSGNSSQ